MKRDSTVTEWSHLPMLWSTALPTPSMHCQMCACRSLQMTLDPSCLSSHSWSWRSSELSPQILRGGDKLFPLGCVQIPNPVNLWVWQNGHFTTLSLAWFCCVVIITGVGLEIQEDHIIFLWLHYQAMAGLGSKAGVPVLFLLSYTGDWQWGSKSPKPARTHEGIIWQLHLCVCVWSQIRSLWGYDRDPTHLEQTVSPRNTGLPSYCSLKC